MRFSQRKLARLIASGAIRAVRSCGRGSSRTLIPRSELARYLRSLGGDQ